MKKKYRGALLGAGFLLAGFLLGGGHFLTAKEKSSIREVVKIPPPLGLERLGAEPNISPDGKMEIRQFIQNGGLFFDRAGFLDEIASGCDSDCNYCCCNADGTNCRCCE
ncbi:MAG: hypothetical protein HY609_03185 [Deltaproteobacteria bacterium]|nr:hypothetical protein [Deltaproteobacteria bacterium]MBI4223913.1 hypothetical protein [Deltaproteobacteria bacterium]